MLEKLDFLYRASFLYLLLVADTNIYSISQFYYNNSNLLWENQVTWFGLLHFAKLFFKIYVASFSFFFSST